MLRASSALMLLALTGCHAGPMAAAGLSAGSSVFVAINSDWLAGKLEFLRIGPSKTVTVTPASQVTSAVAK